MQKYVKDELLSPQAQSSTPVIEDNKALRISSILLGVFALVDGVLVSAILDTFMQMGNSDLKRLNATTGLIYNQSTCEALTLMVVVTAACVILCCIAACRKGLTLNKSEATNTHKEVASCQALAIGIIGLTLISCVLNTLTLGRVNFLDIIPLSVVLIPPVMYYKAAEKNRRTGFWRGIKRAEIEAKDVPDMDEFCRSYTIDSKDGMLHPVEDGEQEFVSIMRLDEFLQQNANSPMAQHVQRTYASAHHCAANTFGEYLYGAILIPVEEFDATDGSYDHDISFIWLLSKDHIYFITNDPEDVLLLTKCFEAQSLRKKSCSAVLYELVSYIIHHDNNYLLDLERRLDQLEDNMSTDVNEIPQDFSDYISEARTDLCVIEGFYKQLADMAEDIETSPASILSKESRELYSSLDNKASRLASDTHMLREYVLQIRSIYQEKIDVRQNNVISVLTIVTSIFMPLTLLTGWYGMNFENMPELHQPYAYFLMIILAVLTVTVEICAFKKKRWF